MMKIANETFSRIVILLSFLFLVSYSQLFSQDFDCLDCHENLIENSVHFDDIECQDCHYDVEDEDHIDSGAAKVECSDCHEEFADLQKKNIHHRLKRKVVNPPTCKTCHGSHEISSPSRSRNKVRDYCSKCHDNIVLVQNYHSESVTNETCFECHDTIEYEPNIERSVHNQLNCADCHNYISHNLKSHPEDIEKLQRADCYICHNEIAVVHRESIHGISLIGGIDEAAQCWDCHGSHEITYVKSEESKVNPKNLSATCGGCHNDEELIEKYDISPIAASRDYETSVHGKLVAEGIKAADCSSCHGVHNIKNRVQPGSSISVFNLPALCGQCHSNISEEYTQSIHWIRAKKGVRNSPVCTDCHSEHGIHEISIEDRQTEIKKIQEEKCIQCHSSTAIAGDNGRQVLKYQDSYHGLAVMSGLENAAMCIDCHGIHKILPASHPESTVNDENITETCRTCHLDSTPVFAKSYTHTPATAQAKWVEELVETIYIWMIIIVIGGMLLHNLLIFIQEMEFKRKKEANEIRVPRLTNNEIIQHLILLISFIILAMTGFALKYPQSFWAEGLVELGMTEGVRRIIHRISAFVMIGLGLYHIIYLWSTPRGREVLWSLLPRMEDLKAAINSILYYLKLTDKKPEYDNYDYAEKAEYWALIWGTLIMGITGIFLMYPTFVGDWAPVWFIRVCETIHFYEAILASLAIIVWHWFFVIFRPSSYPMSFTWIDGKMTLHHYKEHHKLHMRRVFLEVLKLKEGKTDLKSVSNYTKLFIDTLKKQELEAYQVVVDKLNEDDELKEWIESNMN